MGVHGQEENGEKLARCQTRGARDATLFPASTPRLRAAGALGFPRAMHVSFNLAADFDAALKSAAVAAGLADAAAFAPEVRTADARHGDFQANGVLGYAKARKLNPRATAEKLVAALAPDVREACEIPGFH